MQNTHFLVPSGRSGCRFSIVESFGSHHLRRALSGLFQVMVRLHQFNKVPSLPGKGCKGDTRWLSEASRDPDATCSHVRPALMFEYPPGQSYLSHVATIQSPFPTGQGGASAGGASSEPVIHNLMHLSRFRKVVIIESHERTCSPSAAQLSPQTFPPSLCLPLSLPPSLPLPLPVKGFMHRVRASREEGAPQGRRIGACKLDSPNAFIKWFQKVNSPTKPLTHCFDW